jgi:uncharacterized secreted protein with C-terminal beta-propeller domain
MMRRRTLTILTAGLAGLVFACGQGGPGLLTGQVKQPLEALVPLQGCGEVESYIRERLVAEMHQYVDDQIAAVKKSTYACYSYGGSYGYADAGAAIPTSTPPTVPAPSGADDSSASAPSKVSTTNNQVSGVDEADFVKNDDHFLYVVGNGALRIVKAWPANESSLVSKVDLEGEPRKLFVEGDRALVYVSVTKESDTSSRPYDYPGYRSPECTYGYDCVPSGDGTTTKILVFDISDRSAPTKLREIDLSGSLLAARRIGNAVHTVVVDNPKEIDGLTYSLTDTGCKSDDPIDVQRQTMIDAWEALRTKNLQAIADAEVTNLLPTIEENGASAVGACSGYFRPKVSEGRSLTSLVSIDIGGGAPTTATVISDPGVVYASATGLYMSVPHTKTDEGTWYDSMAEEKQASTVHEFRIGSTPALTGYVASGIVKGRVLNQFALDEYDGHLRVATTTSHAPDPKTHSTLSVLTRSGNALTLSGKVDDIAPTEDIRSVRFDGARGYVVTFKKTDPLFVFDLQNASAPTLTGELQIPGFSTYMHLMDPTHLLTIGYDADDQGSFAWFQGVMLQIFDVSDMHNPTLLHKEVIGTRGSSSEALTNHLAFNYFAPKNLLALPMTICEGGSGGTYGTNMTFAGLMVYDVTVQNGFSLRGKVAHPQTSSGGYDSGACSNWWTQASSEVKRSVIMDDFVYSISDKRVKVNTLPNLSADIADISLEN